MTYRQKLKEWGARRKEIAKQYRGGKSVRDIATSYDLTTERVRVLLKKEGVTLKAVRR